MRPSEGIFVQYSRVGRAIFSLEGACLEITRRVFTKEVSLIPLHSLSPRYQMVRFRAWRIILIPLIVSSIAGIISYLVWKIEFAPIEMMAIYPGMFSITLLILAIRGIPKIDGAQFFDLQGAPVLFIARSRKQADEFDRFVKELATQIASRSLGGADK